MKRTLLIFLALAGTLALAGCSKDDATAPVNPVAAEQEAAAGDAALGSGDYAAANEHYRTALTHDPTNPRANVGAAVTEVYLIQADPEVSDAVNTIGGLAPGFPLRAGGIERVAPRFGLVARLGMSGQANWDPITLGRGMSRLMLEAAQDPVMLSQIQSCIRRKVLPRLQYVEARLNRVEAHSNFVLLVPPSVTHEPDTIEVDLGEAYVLDAVVNNIQGVLGVLVAYNFDAPYETAPPESLLAPGTDFGTLWDDGAVQLANARLNLLEARGALEMAIAFISGETDDQSDDVIPKNVLESQDFDEFHHGFNQIYDALNAPVTIEVEDYQNNPVSVSIQLRNFFTTPIADWKTKLPAHTFVGGEPVLNDPLDFPDPTFNGIFPEMTDETWRQLVGPLNPPVTARMRTLRVASH